MLKLPSDHLFTKFLGALADGRIVRKRILAGLIGLGLFPDAPVIAVHGLIG